MFKFKILVLGGIGLVLLVSYLTKWLFWLIGSGVAVLLIIWVATIILKWVNKKL